MNDVAAKADKIAKLLRKAEVTDNDEEAKTFFEQAQRLQAKWAVDDLMLAKARGENGQEKEVIIDARIPFEGVYSQALMRIGSQVAKANNVRPIQIARYRGSGVDLEIIGFKSDVERVQMLVSSLMVQQVGAQRRWAKAIDMSWMTASQKFKERREFIFGYAEGVGLKLALAAKAGQADAAEEEAKRANVSSADAKDSVALVLRTRAERVDDWVDDKYGNSLRQVNRRYARGGAGARGAGIQAGSAADVNQGGIGGNAKRLGA